jgi:hypothetical protein
MHAAPLEAWAARSISRLVSLGLLVAAGTGVTAQPVLEVEPLPDLEVSLSWLNNVASVLETSTRLGPGADWQPVDRAATVVDGRASLIFFPDDQQRFFRLRQSSAPAVSLATVRETSPAQGESGVAVARETIFRLSAPLAPDATLDTSRLFAVAGGRKLLSRAALSSDRRTATLFYLENLPADARVEVTFDGTGLFDANNLPVDLDGDGVIGGAARLVFTTLSTMALSTTGVEGRVLAADKNPDGTERPLEKVTITVDGMEETLRTTTDASGFFRLLPSPAGRFFVSVDGRMAQGSQWPGGAYYPFVGKAWDASPGRTNNLAGGSGIIYLPLIQADALQTVSAVSETKITFATSVLATNPALAGVEITVPANALFSDDGTRGGMVGIAPVPFDRLPEPLPPGLNLPLVITIQTDGARNFDVPVGVKFPNLPDPVTGVKLGPGAKTALWSFNHDTGRWEIQGSMTISADGNFAVSDPGVGVRQPGWHASAPGSGGCGTDCEEDPPCEPCDKPKKKSDCSDFETIWDYNCEDNPCKLESQLLINSAFDLSSDLGIALTDGSGSDAADCAIGVGLTAARAARDCQLNLEACGDVSAQFWSNPIIDGAVGSAFGCVPKVGAILGGLWSMKSVLLNIKAVNDCVKRQSTSLSLQRAGTSAVSPGGGNVGAVLSRLIALIEEQIELSTAAHNLMEQMWGSAVWAGADSPNQMPIYQDFFRAIQAAVAVNSPEGGLITAAEREGLLAVPRPNNASLADLDQLLARLAAMARGEFRAGAPGADAFIAAFAEMETVAAAREADGWTTFFDGLMLALSELSGLVEPEAGSSAYPARQRQGPAVAKLAVSPAPSTEMAFPAKAHFFALLDMRSGFVRRGRLGDDGRFPPLILPPSSPFIVSYFNSDSGHTGSAYFFSARSGRTVRIPAALMGPDQGADSDGDELSDFQESIRGTNAQSRDSDGDGVPDGAEIASGTNPLDGQPLGVGVVATRDTPGNAVELDTVNDLAVVADSASGLAVFNVVNPLSPVLVNQLLPASGGFNAVATAGEFVAAVPGASGTTAARVHLFRLAADGTLTPAGSAAVGAVPGTVVAAGRYAYAPGRSANAPSLAVVELEGAVVRRHALVPDGSAITALALDGDVLWGLSTSNLLSFRIAADTLQPLGELPVNLSRLAFQSVNLTAGNGRVYIGFAEGFQVIDGSDPAAPKLLHAPSRSLPTPAFDVALNGSGLLLPVTIFGGTGNLGLSAYNVREDRATNFLASYDTPGSARSALLHRGYALVADGTAGLAVLNYLAPDRGTRPPTVALRALVSHPPADQEADQAFFVSTVTTDDVQVRDVEFYVDGMNVARSGKYPFAATLLAPPRTAGKTSFLLRAKATDTGGKSAWSQELTLRLLPDLTPARLIAHSPAHNVALPRGSLSVLSATFDSVMNLASLQSGWTLTAEGVDGNLGTADDALVTGGEVGYDLQQRTVLLRYDAPLRSGKYRSRLAASVIDLGGNPLGTNVTWEFSIPNPRPVSANPPDRSVWQTDTLRRVEVRFDERLTASSVTPASLGVVPASPAGSPPLPGGVTSVSSDGRGAMLEFPQPVANGAYRLLFTPEIRDVFGSPVETNLPVAFSVKGPTLWSTNVSGSWTNGRNWSTGLAPILNDHVIIDRPASDILVTLNSDPTLTTLRSTEDLFLNGRRLNVTDTAEVLGGLRWNSRGTLAGRVIDLRGDTLIMGGGTGSESGGNTYAANAARLERGVLRNSGRIEFRTGRWRLETTNAVIENLSGGVIRLAPTNTPNIARDQIEGASAGGGTITSRLVNHGLIEAQPDGRAWRLGFLDTENIGIIRLPDSPLEVVGGFFRNTTGGTLAALAMKIESADIVSFKGSVNLPGGLSFLNNSSFETLTLGTGNLDFGTNGITMRGGTLRVETPITLRRLVMERTDARLRLNADLTVTDSASLIIQRAEGAGQLRLLGASEAAGGWILYDTVRLENFGALQILDASVTCNHDSFFINQASGVVEVTDGASIRGGSLSLTRLTPVGTNYGVIRRLGARESRLQLANDGRVEVPSGTAVFNRGTHHGRFEVAAGATLEITDDGILETASVVTGEGQLVLNDSAVRGRLEIRRVVLDRGTALLDGNYFLRELEVKLAPFRARGSVEVTDRLIVATNGAFRMEQGLLRLRGAQAIGSLLLGEGAILENAGQLTVMGGLSPGSSFLPATVASRVVNLPGATLTLTGGGGANRAPLVNQGTFIKEGAATVELLGPGITNSGVILVRGGVLRPALTQTPVGEIQLAGGNVELLQLTSGILSGSGTNLSSFRNNATVRPGSPLGILRILTARSSGRYEQTANGVLEIEIGGLQPGADHDQVIADQELWLAGTLRLTLRNNFVPEIGQEFIILTGSNLSLTRPRFDTVEGAALGGGKRFEVVYESNRVLVRCVTVP